MQNISTLMRKNSKSEGRAYWKLFDKLFILYAYCITVYIIFSGHDYWYNAPDYSKWFATSQKINRIM